MAKVIARHQEGICLNPYEFVLDDEGEVMTFKDDQEAINLLNASSDVEQTKEEWEEEGIYILDESES